MLYGARSNGNGHGLVLTKPEVVNFMLDRVNYKEENNLKDLVVIEPSAGDGAFVIPIIERLVQSSKRYDFDFQNALKNIIAFEIDSELTNSLETRINNFLVERGFNKVLHIVKNEDFLLSECSTADLYIGNPPYVRHEKIPLNQKREYKKRFRTFNKRADLFIPFYEKCLRNLSSNGLVSFICSNRWLKSQYGYSLRELIKLNFNLHEIIDLEKASPFQEEVIAYPAITTIGKKSHKSPNNYYSISDIDNLSLIDSTVVPERKLEVSNTANWFQSEVIETKYLKHFDTIQNQGFKIGIGVASGADKIFISKSFKGEIEEELLLPILTSKDIRNNTFSWSGSYILNPYNDQGGLIDLKKFPKAKQYLEQNKTQLSQRHVAKKQPQNWYKTIDRIHPTLRHKEKIILPDISGNTHIFIDTGNYYPHHNLYYISGGKRKNDLKVLASILMSDMVKNQLYELGNKMNGGYPRWQSQNLKKILIPIIDSIPIRDRAALISAYDNKDLIDINHIITQFDYDTFKITAGQLKLLEPETKYKTASQ